MNNKEYYDRIAKKYDGIQAVMHSSKLLGLYRNMLEKIVLTRYLPNETKNPWIKNVLDIGCGNERFFKLFWKKGYKITGVDFSKELLNEVKSKFQSKIYVTSYKYPYSIYPPPTLILGLCSNLPKRIKKEKFDYVTLLLTLPHDNKKVISNTIKEIDRILKPKGKLFIMDEPDTNGSLWTKETLISSLKNYTLIEDRFIRSDTASNLFSKDKKKDIKAIYTNKKADIQGSWIKDTIKILIDVWIDIPSIIIRKKEKGFERLLVFEKKEMRHE